MCRALGAVKEIDESWRALDARYGESWRRYHSWSHIHACLVELDRIDPLGTAIPSGPKTGPTRGSRLPILEAAIWFHDAVYDPRRSDNEEKSAELVLELGDRMGIHREAIEAIALLVLATKHFPSSGMGGERVEPSLPGIGSRVPPENAALIRDIDLAILGSAWEEFEAYETGIRKEYFFVPDAEYREKRTGAMRQFLELPAIYRTPRFASLYEARARENLSRLILSLRS
jgi:predicted metal-dependent HD superfamily phosphohydrolase